MPKITFIHVSDFHFREKSFDHKIVNDELLLDIKKWKNKNPSAAIDCIFITGDIAYSGLRNEYQLALPFVIDLLNISGCDKNHLFIVPGNHDVNLSSVSDEEKKLITEVRTKEISPAYALAKNNKLLLNKFDSYIEFIEEIDSKNCNWSRTVEGNIKPWYSTQINNTKFRILGLNSSLFQANRKDGIDYSHYTIIDQFKDAMIECDNRDFIIMLTHHPLDPLSEQEKLDLKVLASKLSILHLFGHVHVNQNYSQIIAPDLRYVSLSAGCIFSKNGLIGNYAICELDTDTNKLKIWPKRWAVTSKRWVPDNDWCDLGSDNSYIIDLPGRNLKTVNLEDAQVIASTPESVTIVPGPGEGSIESKEEEAKSKYRDNEMPARLVIKTVPNPKLILVGGDTAILSAYLFLNGSLLTQPGIVVTFSQDNGDIAYLPSVTRTVTNNEGIASIILTATLKPGITNVTAEASFVGVSIKDTTEVNVTEWGTICGKVIDRHGNGIPNAAVTLWIYEYNQIKSCFENTSKYPSPSNPRLTISRKEIGEIGFYEFSRIASGNYCITAERNGKSYFTIVNVTKGTLTQDILIPV